MAAGFTLAVGVLGWGFLAVLERFLRRAQTVWTVLAAAVLALSFGPILTVEAESWIRTWRSRASFASDV